MIAILNLVTEISANVYKPITNSVSIQQFDYYCLCFGVCLARGWSYAICNLKCLVFLLTVFQVISAFCWVIRLRSRQLRDSEISLSQFLFAIQREHSILIIYWISARLCLRKLCLQKCCSSAGLLDFEGFPWFDGFTTCAWTELTCLLTLFSGLSDSLLFDLTPITPSVLFLRFIALWQTYMILTNLSDFWPSQAWPMELIELGSHY